jgi:hypothetical protein
MTTTPVRRGTRTAVRLHRDTASRGTFPALPEAPSDDPYCAEHGQRFDPATGCPPCVEVAQ